MWARQWENFPLLTARYFKDVPEENVQRVVTLVRDHFKLVPDDALTEKLLDKMRILYNGYSSGLSAHYRVECSNDYDKALANPPKNCTNMEDWKAMCAVFDNEEFQTKSDQASRARKSQVLKHSNGPTSFSQSMHSRGKMKAMKEQVERGELDMSLEDIYHANIPSSSSGKKRRRGKDSSVCYYSKTEEQLAEMHEKLDAANSERSRQAMEIKQLKKQSKNEGTKVMQLLNQVFVSLGREPLPEDALDEEEEGVYEDVDREYADEELVNEEGGDGNIYHANIPSSSSGKKRRRGKDSSVCYYSKTEEQLAEMHEKLDAANSERSRQAMEIKQLKKQSKNEGTKVMQLLNQVFVSLGREPLPEDALDEEEEGVYEDVDREYADEELVNEEGGDGNMEDNGCTWRRINFLIDQLVDVSVSLLLT
ncbi:uncharacterized protein LOC113321884 [Papaver somniferum]|uniref:uncharacterized protein LOC113321884 n=1 Tax=Papaver somniferum TaxID=3469 RepID=UPI000E6F94CB|nr:uncharacterized protein LOC113321884 [Papaver somniferum]